MEKCTWKATLLPGKKAEYIRRHDALWPEMAETLRQAGIRNYTIWCCGDELFGYYECERGAAYAARVQAESPVVARWNEYMRDVNKGLPIAVPRNYYRNNNPALGPVVRWRGHANLLFTNWLNYYVYQETPFRIEDISKLGNL